VAAMRPHNFAFERTRFARLSPRRQTALQDRNTSAPNPSMITNDVDPMLRAFLEDVELRRALPAAAQQVRYQDRLLAFLDILGWAALIEKSRTSRATLRRLAAIQFSAQAYGRLSRKVAHPLGETMTHFSDSLVLSWPWPHNANDLSRILLDLARLAHQLLRSRILVRGAAVRGKVFHTPHVVFGPAIVEAYRFESGMAIYPRIIVAESVARARASNILRRDADGLLFLDFMALGSHLPTYAPFLLQVRNFIMEEIRRAGPSPPARQKLMWFQHYVERLIREGKQPSTPSNKGLQPTKARPAPRGTRSRE